MIMEAKRGVLLAQKGREGCGSEVQIVYLVSCSFTMY